jgi:hypothetical protein
MVTLQHDRAECLLVTESCRTRWPADFDVLMHDLAIVNDLDEPGVGNLFSIFIKTWGAEGDIELLPLSWWSAGIEFGRVSFVASLFTPTLVNPTAVAMLEFCFTPTVEHLYLVASLKVDARIRALGHDKFDVSLHIAMLMLAE